MVFRCHPHSSTQSRLREVLLLALLPMLLLLLLLALPLHACKSSQRCDLHRTREQHNGGSQSGESVSAPAGTLGALPACFFGTVRRTALPGSRADLLLCAQSVRVSPAAS